MSRSIGNRISVRQLLGGVGIFAISLLLIDHILVSNLMGNVFKDVHRIVDTSGGDSRVTMAADTGLSNEELAWHARNNYGWDCDEIVARGQMSSAGYFSTTCSNGRILRVYPRGYSRPRITNMSGGNY